MNYRVEMLIELFRGRAFTEVRASHSPHVFVGIGREGAITILALKAMFEHQLCCNDYHLRSEGIAFLAMGEEVLEGCISGICLAADEKILVDHNEYAGGILLGVPRAVMRASRRYRWSQKAADVNVHYFVDKKVGIGVEDLVAKREFKEIYYVSNDDEIVDATIKNCTNVLWEEHKDYPPYEKLTCLFLDMVLQNIKTSELTDEECEMMLHRDGLVNGIFLSDIKPESNEDIFARSELLRQAIMKNIKVDFVLNGPVYICSYIERVIDRLARFESVFKREKNVVAMEITEYLRQDFQDIFIQFTELSQRISVIKRAARNLSVDLYSEEADTELVSYVSSHREALMDVIAEFGSEKCFYMYLTQNMQVWTGSYLLDPVSYREQMVPYERSIQDSLELFFCEVFVEKNEDLKRILSEDYDS